MVIKGMEDDEEDKQGDENDNEKAIRRMRG